MQTTSLTKEQKYELLTKDFLERDGETFVRIRKEGRLGWEDTLPADSAYSEAILHPKDERELLKNACTLARQMIISMNTPFKVNIHINANRSCTDSRDVFVATEVFDDPQLPLGRKLDTFLGLAIHEGSHLLYTDFDRLWNEKDMSQALHQLVNIIEDEMIERKLGEESPGLANFLKATKYYYFGRYKDNSDKLPEDDVVRLFNAILAIVRYPAALRPEDAQVYTDELLEVREILTPYPQNTNESIAAARKILEVLRKYMKEENKQSGNSQDQSGDGQSQSKDGQSQSGNDQDQSGNSSGDDSQNDKNKPQQSPGGNNKTKDVSDQDIDNRLKKVLKASEQLCDDHTEQKNEGTEKQMCKAAQRNGQIIAKECDGDIEIGDTSNTILVRKQPNKYRYNESLARVKKYIPSIATALRQKSTTYSYNIRGKRNGLLDTGKLAEARQGIPTVYTSIGKVTTDKVNLVLVIDESGSMDGRRAMLARDTAVLINEAVGNITNVNLNIYGYTNKVYNEIYPYREGRKPYDKYEMGSIKGISGTPTAEAVRECVIRVRRESKEKSIMLIISDGHANDGSDSVRRETLKAAANGFKVIGISISSNLDESELKQMYDEYIVMNDISDLARDMGKTVKKAIMKNTKKTF